MNANIAEFIALLVGLDRRDLELLGELLTLPEQDRGSAVVRLLKDLQRDE